MERLTHAVWLIADIRLGADPLLEPYFSPQSLINDLSALLCLLKKTPPCANTSKTFAPLLEELGMLNESLRSRTNSWGLHMPRVCPDGVVVAYARKRQLAGQAGGSAVHRNRLLEPLVSWPSLAKCGTNERKRIGTKRLRLALKAFTDQMRGFFPHLGGLTEPASKKHCGAQAPGEKNQDEPNNYKSLSDVLTCLEKEVPNLKFF